MKLTRPPTAAPLHLPTYELPLHAQALTARYGSREVLSKVDLKVESGEIRVILGGSGGGKTTLLKHLIGLLPPLHGQVHLLGVELVSADEPLREAVLRKIGMLFQSGALINSLTVLENVALPLRECTDLPAALIDDICWMKLMLVGLEQAARRTPPELSGGMKKRAALARAMALDPRILFCDEPSAGLDPVMAAEIDQLLLSLRERFNTTLVVVTHELASIRRIADKVTMLAGGRVIADGTLQTVEQLEEPVVRHFFDRIAKPRIATHAPSVLDALLNFAAPLPLSAVGATPQ